MKILRNNNVDYRFSYRVVYTKTAVFVINLVHYLLYNLKVFETCSYILGELCLVKLCKMTGL